MVKQNEDDQIKSAGQRIELERTSGRLDMLDRRLDNMDSVITSLVERVMGKPLTMEITCPNCGKTIQINITSSTRLRGREETGVGD